MKELSEYYTKKAYRDDLVRFMECYNGTHVGLDFLTIKNR
jgi:hypothetical protein